MKKSVRTRSSSSHYLLLLPKAHLTFCWYMFVPSDGNAVECDCWAVVLAWLCRSIGWSGSCSWSRVWWRWRTPRPYHSRPSACTAALPTPQSRFRFFSRCCKLFLSFQKIVVFLHLQTGKNPLAEKSAFFRYSADGETSTTSQKTSRNNGDCSLVLYSYYTTYDKWSVPKILICLFNKGSRSPTVRDRDKWMAPLFSHGLI